MSSPTRAAVPAGASPPSTIPAPPTGRPDVARGAGAARIVVPVVLAVLLAGAVVASLAVGSHHVGLPDVVAAVTGGRDGDAVIVRDLRLPRTVLGALVGMCLGAAGTVVQGVTRNPLGDPGLLGISAGAAFAVALGIGFAGLTDPAQYVWFAFLGGAIAGVVTYGVGGLGSGGATPVKLALAGAAVTALLDSATSGLVLLDVRTLDQYRYWAVGSLAGRDAGVAGDVAPFAAAGLLLALALAGRLNALALGDDLAVGLGVSVRGTRALGSLAVILLTGAAVAAAGPVTFVGLVVPHVVRAFTGPDVRWSLPSAALGGAVLMLTADVLGRVVAPPGELEAGVVTALIGAPFLAYLVKAGRMKETAR